ncbi:abortive infection family protein [Amycolatopsis sp. NPDC059657]|uniref:abortive infection family protein n=1 Tax=Amycolatopsis sp. NPDC059657 TaxID=3346899 RepID=UPI003672BDDE
MATVAGRKLVVSTRPDNSHASSRITEVTRRRILDELRLGDFAWAGRLDEVEFLSRLYDLDALPSFDSRYQTARRDIVQHRFNNEDWEEDWVFRDERFELERGPDDVLLRFLAEMLHPMVRSDTGEVQDLLRQFNDALRPDGYELVVAGAISGLPVHEGRLRGTFHGERLLLGLDNRPLLTDSTVLHEHLARISGSVSRDPAAAIGSAKELVESLCKIILERSGQNYPRSEDLPALYRRVAELLRLNAESVPESAKGSQTSQKILRTLSTTVQSICELRNELGLGHGRSLPSPALARHARLALNSTVTVTEFLLDTWQDRVNSGALVIVSTK